MSYTIKKTDGSDLYVSEAATDVRGAVVEAVWKKADLGEADLRGADLYGADLYGADLRWADLGGANLRGADLSGANLREAKCAFAPEGWTVKDGVLVSVDGSDERKADA
jgi:hypothetical protein